MKKVLFITLFILISISVFALEPFHEISAGYYGDTGVSLALRLEEESSDFPFFIQARGGYVYQLDPGNATDARAIFINDNTGGNIEKYGESYLAAMDLGWKWTPSEKLFLEVTVSGLWNYYSAHYAFIGNNEAFTVTSDPFGIGAGAALRFPINDSSSTLLLKGGGEYFFKSQLDAHGTYYYTPDGLDERPRNDYTYEDADTAVNQPGWRAFLQIAYLYTIGR